MNSNRNPQFDLPSKSCLAEGSAFFFFLKTGSCLHSRQAGLLIYCAAQVNCDHSPQFHIQECWDCRCEPPCLASQFCGLGVCLCSVGYAGLSRARGSHHAHSIMLFSIPLRSDLSLSPGERSASPSHPSMSAPTVLGEGVATPCLCGCRGAELRPWGLCSQTEPPAQPILSSS